MPALRASGAAGPLDVAAREGCGLRLVTFSWGRERERLGVVLGPAEAWETIVDLHGSDSTLPSDMLSFIDAAGSLSGATWRRAQAAVRRAAGAVGRTRPRYAHPADRVRLHVPVRPRMLRDFIAFRGHIARTRASRGEQVPAEWDQVPAYYNGDHLNLLGPGATVPWPRYALFAAGLWRYEYSKKLDYELEIGYVVGQTSEATPEGSAPPTLFGVTIFNDFSMRDLQAVAGRVGMGPAAGKDWVNVLGPCIVTRDEFGALAKQHVSVRINGTPRLRGRFDELVTKNPLFDPGVRTSWSFDEIARFLTQNQTVHAGEVWGSGTIPGGCEFEKGEAAAYLVPGDRVDLEVEGIGVLSNTLGQPPADAV